MLEKILDYERVLFLQLNSIHSPFGDQFMWLYSGTVGWIPLVVCFIILLFYANRTRWKEVLLIVVAIAVTILMSDQFASGLCKPFFARYRPTFHPDFMNDVMTVFDYRGGRYGFISSHAANGFGFATVTSLIFRKKIYTVSLFLWATVSAYSRIYLGVHFISDIIPGILAGLFFGWTGYQLFALVHKKIFCHLFVEKDDAPSLLTNKKSLYPCNGIKSTLSFLLVTIVLMVIISALYTFHLIPAVLIK